MTIDFESLNSLQLDVLKELGNIGAGNAVTALGKMIDKKIHMQVPKVELLEFDKVGDMLGGADTPAVGVLFRFEGEITGNIMFLLPIHSARTLLEILTDKTGDSEEFSSMEESALEEAGNILVSAYISSLCVLTGMRLNISVPALAIDMVGAILSVPIIQFGQIGDRVLLIETQFSEGDFSVKGDFLLIPDVGSFEKLLRDLGVA